MWKGFQLEPQARHPGIVLELRSCQEEIADILAVMKTRASAVGMDMLKAISRLGNDYSYFVAKNGRGENARYGVMVLGAPPFGQAQADRNEMESGIHRSLWVEALIADPRSGLGARLLETAEKLGAEGGWPAISLSAYEDEATEPDSPAYSIAGYYEKRNFTYSGQANVEKESGEEYYYPIYMKYIGREEGAGYSRK
jgi:hypothetical protein